MEPLDIITLEQLQDLLGWSYARCYGLIYRPDPMNPPDGFLRFKKLGKRWITRQAWIEEDLERRDEPKAAEPIKPVRRKKRPPTVELPAGYETWGDNYR